MMPDPSRATPPTPLGQIVAETPKWMRGPRACKDPENFELFFPKPEEGQASATTKVNAAKKLCRQCRYAQRCLEFALDKRLLVGVYGATSGNERAKILRYRAKGFRHPLDPRPDDST